ncbi:MAG: phosphoribosylaminoimidazolesuccinocarboxamide synthase [Desulfobacterales bacterium]|nr:phosphoribosylaminoimidazolesuccinocarboxamide synthase [Desulfobacterales bacterium]MDJ0990369.1 phosphoribosylaminoimidazolesuccinocarboxamide synthase [Desulfobacterales bacterium]
MPKPVFETNLDGLELLKKGKVRDLYDLGDYLLMVATDRISAFDVIMPDPIPDKGKILTQISLFWFEQMANLVPNHLVAHEVQDFPAACQPHAEALRGRSMLVKKVEVLPIECVVRGYLSGSGWKSYQQTGDVCGIKLPPGLVESDQLPEPIFTPSTKEELGKHDINISFAEMVDRVGQDLAAAARDLSLAIYRQGVSLAKRKGIIIADTKFEFGLDNGKLILIDEVLTPDSSRFWPDSSYRPGGAQPSFDKQYVRDYLTSIKFAKTPPGPRLPEEVINGTRSKYLEALTLLTGDAHGI